MNNILDGVKSGTEYLHSLGLVHNNIILSNIMLVGHTPVITDFNSCRPVGENLEMDGANLLGACVSVLCIPV